MKHKQHTTKCEFTRRMTVDVHAQHPKLNEKYCDCDGYHTFDELYEHRITLFITLCEQIINRDIGNDSKSIEDYTEVWRSKLHSDGSSLDGWFIMGIGTEKGEQITYHLPMDKWNETDFANTLEQAPEFDGHTSDDVLERLKKL